MLENLEEEFVGFARELSIEEKAKLVDQNRRLVSELQAKQLEKNAQRHWDLFYKRNETRFFKDRRWTTREFEELLSEPGSSRKVLLEVGCGVGNFIFPLVQENRNDYFYHACDFSPRAIEHVKKNPLYDPERMNAFCCDVTTETIFEYIQRDSLDIITLVFVLSAIHPDKFRVVLRHLSSLLKPGGVLLFRDYGLHDMAQLRFKPGHKITENFYMRQDGTRSYYFSELEIADLMSECGLEVKTNCYIYRRTVNAKEGIDVPRIFIQGKYKKVDRVRNKDIR